MVTVEDQLERETIYRKNLEEQTGLVAAVAAAVAAAPADADAADAAGFEMDFLTLHNFSVTFFTLGFRLF